MSSRNRRLWVAVALLLISRVLWASPSTEGASKLGFLTDKSAALAQAGTRQQPILAFFTTDWCGWCRRLEADVLGTPEFLAGSAGWVKLVIDAEKGDGVDWAKRFHVSGYPTLILLDDKGGEIDRQSGYAPMPGYLNIFQDYQAGIGTLAALQAECALKPQDQALALQVAGKLAGRGQVDEARAVYQGVLDSDPQNVQGGADEAAGELALLQFRAGKDPAVLEAVLTSWKGLEQGPQLYNALVALAAKAGDDARMQTLLERAVAEYPANVELLNSYAWTGAEKGWNLDRALELAQRAVDLSQRDPNVLDTLAEVQFRRGEREAAQATIQEALRSRPGDPYLTGQLTRFQTQP